MIELQVLHALLKKDTWITYRKFINKEQLTKELSTLLDILDTYYSNKDGDLTVQEFEIICETSGKLDKTHRAVLETLGSCHVRPELVEDLLKAYKQKSVLSRLALASYDASEGRKGLESVHKLIQQLDEAPNSPSQGDIYFDTIEQTIKTYNGTIWYDVAGPKELIDHQHYAGEGYVRHADYGNYVEFNNVVSMDGGNASSNYSSAPNNDIIDGGTANGS